MKAKLRVSYSLLTLWNNGRWEDAVKMYLHQKTPKTQAMKDGLRLHIEWGKEIKKTNLLKLENSKFEFKKPALEKKVVVSYSDRYDISGTFDCLDGDLLWEFKSGVANSLQYVNNNQLPLYFLIAELAGIKIKKANLIHYNQHISKVDTAILWNSPRVIKEAKNFIDSLAPEIEAHFIKNKIPMGKK